MNKLIIDNRIKIPILECLEYVKGVLKMGKISETSKGKQYPFITGWKNGVVIYADKNKKSDRLVVDYDDLKKGEING